MTPRSVSNGPLTGTAGNHRRVGDDDQFAEDGGQVGRG